jgi:hypothetical protein
MSAIQTKIGQILEGFRKGHVQFEETVGLLDSYFETLPAQTHKELFEVLWAQYRSEPISHLSSKANGSSVDRSGVVRVRPCQQPADQPFLDDRLEQLATGRVLGNRRWGRIRQLVVVLSGAILESRAKVIGRKTSRSCCEFKLSNTFTHYSTK